MDYPWYELVKKDKRITQGDILKHCPVPILKHIPKEEKTIIQAEMEYVDGIILTQACDLENRKVDNIILCSITSKTDFENQMKSRNKGDKEITKNIEGIIKGQQNAYHIINEYKTDEFSQDYYIINFKDIYSVPVGLAMSVAESNDKRLRLCPPYREHLSQAFARYFMRVGLPINIHMK
jgi:hypothetical protein